MLYPCECVREVNFFFKVFHMLGSLRDFGRCGMTAIGASPEEAQSIYEEVIATLDRRAAAVHAKNKPHSAKL
jgi:hypothetical protein